MSDVEIVLGVRGRLLRGAQRFNPDVGAVGLLILLLAVVTLLGYVGVVVFPVLAVRMRGREAARYAGLRTLAK